jgi:hypothetical protein
MNGYFFHDGNEQQGPFTIEELKEKSIKRETPVWKKDLKDWARAGNLPELSHLFENTPPPFQKQPSTSSTAASQKQTLTEKTGLKLGKLLGWTGLFKEEPKERRR